MLYGYYIPFLSTITSCLSCVGVYKVYYSNTLGSVHMICNPILVQEVVWPYTRVAIVVFLLQL